LSVESASFIVFPLFNTIHCFEVFLLPGSVCYSCIFPSILILIVCIKKISSKEARIQDLQLLLASFEKERITSIDDANSALPAPLTKREIEVLRLITQGATNKEISADLNISQHTDKSHVINIFNKIGVNDRARASAWGAIHGIL
jgi:DNA-binding CsgD family transcriptional regulator